MQKILIIAFLGLLTACTSDSNSSYAKAEEVGDMFAVVEEVIELETPRTSEPPPPPGNGTTQKSTKLIKRGTFEIEVDRIERAKASLDAVLQVYGAYYSKEQYNAYYDRKNYDLVVRIPAVYFDSLILRLDGDMGRLKRKEINVRDVTEEYVDLDIRTENKLAYLKRYREILAVAKSVKEILEVQEKIRDIEEEIESNKGRLKYYDDQVAYSTLNISLNELIARPVSDKPGLGRRLQSAFSGGYQGFLNFCVGLVYFWPFLLLVGLLILFRKRINIRNPFRRK